ncbi:hypothetical protein [Janthinobacterium agaricidamnosum]|uniref:Uncharacterized protein n=1 Tax=Janthinobacterium agaricidamnosum NBRC 102515 = DSM 9628 TaxID=1349767 RepID=W0V1R8_9BURK|nr:hypothetical protein [Janthinobacterium agaricidamnosum]CDG81550.1 hypothetical protein GJA_894 [Janthinobacterium agaricidamnosum NBRC 102515 = DSM 9628]
MHIVASGTPTWYGLHARRGMKAIGAHGILSKRLGMLAHDCRAPCRRLEDAVDASCNVRLLRELVYVKEITGQQSPESTIKLLLGANSDAADAMTFTTRFYAVAGRIQPA